MQMGTYEPEEDEAVDKFVKMIEEHAGRLPKDIMVLAVFGVKHYGLDTEDALAVAEACSEELCRVRQDTFLSRESYEERTKIPVGREKKINLLLLLTDHLERLIEMPDDQRGLIEWMRDKYELSPEGAERVAEAFFVEMALREEERRSSPPAPAVPGM